MKLKHLLAISLLTVFATGCATGSQNADLSTDQQVAKVVRPSQAEIDAKVVQELEQLGEKELAKEEAQAAKGQKDQKDVTYDIPITLNAKVNYFIDYFQTKVPKRFRIWLERSGRYVPMMRSVLRQYGLPEDLVYLSMIESGFSCRAYSWAHACGPWQFIRGTGRRYGLKIDYWVDERRDPVKATHAAAQYLRDLYAEFGSWYLAAAGYNAGEAKIRRALKRYKADDFWEISHNKRRYLKPETKQYVPKMIAAAIIAKEPAKYGFDNIKYQKPLAYDQVTVHPGTSLSVAAKLAGLKTRELEDLNPELRRWATPPTGMYTLRIPQGQEASFETAYAKLAPTDRKARARAAKVRIHRGDTLGKIARSFGVSVNELMAMNPQLSPRRLRIGQTVYVPPNKKALRASRATSRSRRTALASRSSYTAPHRNRRKIVYKVRKGDTMWDIAQAYGISYKDIRRWNGKRSSRLHLGQKLVLYVPQAKAEAKVELPGQSSRKAIPGERVLTYQVRRGDSLWKISRRFKVTPADLRKWNGMRDNRLNPGDKITVRLDAKL